MKNNLKRRIENAHYMGQQHRFHRKPLETNPFIHYKGIDGDGELIAKAFIAGWQDYDQEINGRKNDQLAKYNAAKCVLTKACREEEAKDNVTEDNVAEDHKVQAEALPLDTEQTFAIDGSLIAA